MSKFGTEFIRGLWKENPTFRLLIGMCPTLAITTAASNGVAMGLATTFVLVCSSALISLLKSLIPDEVRIACYVVIIATFTTIVDYLLAAFLPDMHQILGLFIPLIVVNCTILARAEAFAAKAPVHLAVADGLGMGIGFTWAITLLAAIRELLGAGTIFGYPILGTSFTPIVMAILPPGGFLMLGILISGMNQLTIYLEARRKKAQATSTAVTSSAAAR